MPKVPTTRSSPGEAPQLSRAPSSSQSSRNQQSILGFFQKKAELPTRSANGQESPSAGLPSAKGSSSKHLQLATKRGSTQSLTPAPSSDALGSPNKETSIVALDALENGLPSPVTPMTELGQSRKASRSSSVAVVTFSSPSRKVGMVN